MSHASLNIPAILANLIAFVVSVTVHEFGHALVATKLGDPLPRMMGRMTLNPKDHIDPIGTILFPLIGAFFSVPLIAWGRPVLTNPSAYTRKVSRSTASMLVAIAGPAMNLLLAASLLAIIYVGAKAGIMPPDVAESIAIFLVLKNVSLMLFNLLPMHPLDGGKVLEWMLPPRLQFICDFLRQYGNFILLGLLLVPGIISSVLGPFYRMAVTVIAAVLRGAYS